MNFYMISEQILWAMMVNTYLAKIATCKGAC